MIKKANPVELGTMNVWKLLMQYAIPSIIAMTASSLYNITDSIFIGQGVGALAIAGLTITFPMMNLAAAFGSMVGVGAATLMSLRLGQNDYKTANKILGNVFVLNLIFGVAYSIVVLTFLDPILSFFGASSETIPYARDYMQIITLGNVITHMYMGLNSLLRATGKPRFSMYSTIFTVVINIGLTALFIYGLGWGIRGAALATIIAQTSMLLWQIKIFANKKELVHLKKDTLHIERKIVFDSLSIGLAPFLMNVAMSVVTIVINQSLVRYGGDMAVGAFGIINRVIIFFPMVVLGLTQGMQPIAGYNFGAGKTERVNRVLKYTIFLATGITSLGFIMGMFFPGQVARLFTRDRELIDIVIPGLRTVLMVFPIVGFQMVVSNFFQSVGMARKAIFMSLTRQVFLLLPSLLILPRFFGVMGVWYSMPLSDLLSGLVAAYILGVQYRKSVHKL
jgi:putative MATE family efflux protein